MTSAGRVVAVCDPCLSAGVERTASFSGLVAVGAVHRGWLDLCPQHEDLYLDTVRHALTLFGTWPPEADARVWRHPCPLCSRTYRYRASLRNHLRESHGQSLAEWERRFGRVLPTGLDPSQVLPCEQPGCEYAALGPQGLATHRRTEHVITSAEHWDGDTTHLHRRKDNP